MTCGDFQSIVTDLAHKRISGDDQREAALHARECAACAQRLTDEEGVTRALAQLRVATTEQAPAWIEESLRQAFVTRDQRLAERRTQYWWGAVAAAAVLMLGVAGVTWLRSARDSMVPPVAVESSRTMAPSVPASTPPASTPVVENSARPNAVATKSAAPPRSARRAPTSRARTPVPEEPREIVTDFMWLPYGAPSAFESGQIVRVRIPRSVLPSFGLAMDGRDLAERVQADIVVGEDGLARAIRLVHTQTPGEP